VNLINKKISSTGIRYAEKFESGLPTVWVDGQQMQQVFLNLILNSVDAMSKGDKLTISARTCQKPKSGMIGQSEKRSQKNGHYVEVILADTGSGIAKKNLETIFDPFFTTKPNGLGLGLSIVYRIIEEHKGDIHVDSRVGKGTSITITLPTGAH
jgi:signal transduction histidine kinase